MGREGQQHDFHIPGHPGARQHLRHIPAVPVSSGEPQGRRSAQDRDTAPAFRGVALLKPHAEQRGWLVTQSFHDA